MRTLVTGMVAGMDDADYIRKVVALGQRNHRDIHVYNAVEDFTKAGKKPFERLLGTTDYVFELTRSISLISRYARFHSSFFAKPSTRSTNTALS